MREEKISVTEAKAIAKRLLGAFSMERDSNTFDEIEAIKSWLSTQLSRYLKDSPERLAQLMYRLDIPEDRFHAAIYGEQSVSGIASKLANLIWNRELERLWYRKKYSS